MATQKYRVEYIIIACILVINLALHLIADSHAGFHGDELLHIEAGKHLAFGYMDFPPFIACVAFLQNLFQSNLILFNHLFVYLASTLILIVCGLMTIELGGKNFAVLLSLSAILAAPGIEASHSLFLPDIFDQLAWILCIYLLVRYCKKSDNKYLIYIGLFAAIGFLTKYTILFLIVGFFFSFLIFQIKILKNRVLWISLMLFFLIVTPNILWQVNSGFPVFHHFSILYETQLNKAPILQEIKLLFIYVNPLTSPFWVCGIVVTPFILRYKKYRMVSFTLLIAFFLLFIAKGKSYYFFPIILGALPFGTTFFESLLERRNWILISYLSIICISGIVFLPNGIPLLPLESYIKIYHLKTNADNEIPLPFENYYSSGIWNQILENVNTTYLKLSIEEKKHCLIWGRHYSQSCGINLLGNSLKLPKAFSFHSSCYAWAPDFSRNLTVIGVSEANLGKEYWYRYFEEVEETGFVENHYTSEAKWYKQRIFLCRKLKYNSTELKNILRDEIF